MLALRATLEEAEGAGARAMVLEGGGETYFVGGADGIEMMQLDPDGARSFSARFQGLLDRMEASPLVIAAAIDGLCFGGGLELAMACDLRVATTRTRIGLPEVKVGLIPGGGGTQRLGRLVGHGRAVQMILSGGLLHAEVAAEWGLVHAAVPAAELRPKVDALLEPILARPDYAVRLAKEALGATRLGSLEAGLAAERECFAKCLEHDFFPDLMREQLREGVLQTSADVDRLLEGGDKE
jgi:enoyl-CoA hydratase/carnithine racemase